MSEAGSQVVPPASVPGAYPPPPPPPPPYYGNYQNAYYYPPNPYQPPPYQPPPAYYGYPPSMSDRPSTRTGPSRSGISKKKKMMAVAACFCVVVAFILLALFIYALLRSRDKGTATCNDFYSYACAKWKAHNISGVMEKGHATVQQEITDTIIRGLTEKVDPGFVHLTIFSMISACLNEERIEMKGKAPLQDFLDSLGGWPMVDGKSWDGDMDRAMHVLGDVTRLFGNNAIFAIDVVPNMIQDLKPIIYVQGSHGYLIPINPALFPFIPQFRSSTTHLEQIIFEIVVAISGDVGEQKIFLVNEIKKMISFWSDILKTKSRKKSKINPEVLTVAELSSFTKVNWEILLRRTFFDVQLVTSSSKVFVHEKHLLRDICYTILKSYKPRTVVNFVIFLTIRPLLWHLTEKFQQLFFRLNDEFGIETSKHRGDWCIHGVMEQLPYLIANLHAEQYFKQEDLDTVSDITTTILHTYTDELKKNDWLSKSSKNKIVDKISSLKFEIAFPSSVRNEKVLEDIYEPLNISVDDHFQNILDTSELKAYLKFAYLIDDPKTKLIWRMPPLSVNAWYIQFGNMIQIFAGLLRAANVTSTSSLAHQYGVLGSIIAHEITHALDFSGLKIDKHGRVGGKKNTLEGPLLDRKSAKAFLRKTDCLATQYQGYCLDSKCVDGERTINENLADNSGTRIAFLAFLKKAKSTGHVKNDTLVPEEIRHASLKKQFFFYFNQVWCSEETTSEATDAQIDFDSHSPNKYRVIGTLSNMPEFSDEFECTLFDEMNRKKKCRVW